MASNIKGYAGTFNIIVDETFGNKLYVAGTINLSVPPPPLGFIILQENGSDLLQENLTFTIDQEG